jgi:hypothetical protein
MLHLKEKLDRLILHDPQTTTFGASTSQGGGHNFLLGPTLTEEALAEFEAVHTIVLPPDYRAFLKLVGNGGAGPGYGMSPLAEGLPRNRGKYGSRYLSTPFEYTQPMGEDPDEELPFEDEGGGRFHGCLHLTHRGCGIEDFLIVTGPCRGQIWTDDTCSDGGIYPTAPNFGQWYDQWLDDSFLALYRAKLIKSQYILLAFSTPENWMAFIALFERLKDDQRSGGISTEETTYLMYLNEAARSHFWFPSPQERKAWYEERSRRWDATPLGKRHTDPSLKYPLEFKIAIDVLNRSNIELKDCLQLDDQTATLTYIVSDHAFTASEPLLNLIEAFGGTITETGDGRGPRPSPRWSDAGM